MQAICSYRLLKAPNGKLILILGDVHTSEVFKPHLERFIREVNKTPLKKSMLLIIELEESMIPDAAIGKGIIIGCFKALVDAWHKKNNQVHLECFDPRGGYSNTVEAIRTGLYDKAIASSVLEADMNS